MQIYSNPLNSGFTTNLNNSINNSVTEWSRAGISVSKTTNGMGAEIIAYGGTLAEIKIIRPDYQDSWAGLCVTDSSDKEYIGVYDIYGVPNTVNHYHYTTGAILEVYMREYTLSYDWHKYFMTMTHEIGHGLGFSGHYTSTGTVMYYQVNTTTTLTNTELDHLDQVY